MLLGKNDIHVRDGTGFATLTPQEPEDMWHLYNLIRAGDTLRAPAIRRVTKEAGTGSTVSNTVRTKLTIRVLKTDFDAAAGELHVSGKVCEENTHVSLGSHHTLDLELNRSFTLSKGGDDGWDSIALDMLKEATDMRKRAEVYAVIMDAGLANICVITEHQTLLRQRIESSIPRKRLGHGSDAHDKGLDKFFALTLSTLLRHFDPSTLQTDTKSPPLLLASPGFTASSFHKYILSHAQLTNDKPLLLYARNSILIAHSSSGHVHALAEVLREPTVLSRLSDTKYARESQIMEKFLALLREDDGRAWYGPREVALAVEKGAVGRGGGVLLISNKLFRAPEIRERKRWVGLVERVRNEGGGEVRVLSSAHESGKRLEGLGDIGAILTFPLLDLDEEVSRAEEARKGVGGDLGGRVNGHGYRHDRMGEDEIEMLGL